jgi:uncharacterized membrane protein
MSRHSVIRYIAMVVGALIAGGIAVALGGWEFAPSIGWATAALIYSTWVWIVVGRMDADETRAHAIVEEPARGVADLLVVVVNLASLGSVAIVLAQAADARGIEEVLIAALAILTVALSWILLHTIYMLRYARLYYRDPAGGVDFNQDEKPRYTDFAYLAFTLGMTYQVSDTNITDRRIRSTVLRHSLLSFVFGAFILATTINLIAGLGS